MGFNLGFKGLKSCCIILVLFSTTTRKWTLISSSEPYYSLHKFYVRYNLVLKQTATKQTATKQTATKQTANKQTATKPTRTKNGQFLPYFYATQFTYSFCKSVLLSFRNKMTIYVSWRQDTRLHAGKDLSLPECDAVSMGSSSPNFRRDVVNSYKD